MTLYLKAHTNLSDLMIDFIEVQLANGQTVVLNWDESESSYSDGEVNARYKGVYFDEEYANGKLDDLQQMKVIHVELYSESNEKAVFQIEEMLFEDAGKELLYQGNLYMSQEVD